MIILTVNSEAVVCQPTMFANIFKKLSIAHLCSLSGSVQVKGHRDANTTPFESILETRNKSVCKEREKTEIKDDKPPCKRNLAQVVSNKNYSRQCKACKTKNTDQNLSHGDVTGLSPYYSKGRKAQHGTIQIGCRHTKSTWKQQDQLKVKQRKEFFLEREKELQGKISRLLADRSSALYNRVQLGELVNTTWPDIQESGLTSQLPILEKSAWNLLKRDRHPIVRRVSPGTLSQLPTLLVQERRNMQKKASKRRIADLHRKRLELVKWNCKILELLWKQYHG
ncbi:hypothetical protein GpartN1_g7698.t1 [Galdieria partita]|uniref:Uncharacterized protein n=1 Tax=Galdieria partita TaxID=83374 RepID=A0A9C7UV46_9RHOD|nr:hypothetical protein GpartN1_g7698.t1 [Galdieria partita]